MLGAEGSPGHRCNALRPAPGRIDSFVARWLHRISYVCGSFAIDRFGALASLTAASVRNNGHVAAADAWRAAVWRTFSSYVGLPSSALVRPPEGSETCRATTRT
jgi:hypothetical protein